MRNLSIVSPVSLVLRVASVMSSQRIACKISSLLKGNIYIYIKYRLFSYYMYCDCLCMRQALIRNLKRGEVKATIVCSSS